MPTDALSPPATEELPEEFFLEGPVPGGEELLRRTVARVHRQSARSARLRWAMLLVAVLLVGAMVTGGGMALGRMMFPATPPVAERQLTATDPASGAHMSATLVGVDGGTYIEVSVTGLPMGTTCRLTVFGHDITLHDGSWAIGPDGGRKPVPESAWMPPKDITALMVATSNGVHLYASAG